ncbi:NlpC/P60 family protein [Plantactinospora sp. B5E13]|uniref:NlpC/P60 family protein n=1 Tax=Plantactinospora sp. B5E13 TaxID=3153758 RepID=UPI00325ED66D
MANSRRGQAERTDSTVSPVLRPLLWSALVGAIVAGALATPVWADPPPSNSAPSSVPDPGVRPQLGGAPVTGAPTGTPPPNFQVPSVDGPLASQIYALEVEVAQLGEDLLDLQQARDDKAARMSTAEAALRMAQEDVTRARATAENAAAEALKDAAGLPPGAFGSDLHGLELLKRIQRGEQRSPRDAGLVEAEVQNALAAQRQAETAHQQAVAESRLAEQNFVTAERKYKERTNALLKLKRDNADKLAAIEREREAAEQRLGASIGLDSVNGLVANPKAIRAMNYALAQRGDPYVWAAEGPNQFDCSGLMWAAYRSQGVTLPRVSRDQYNGTKGKTVARSALLPGDLIFFASGSSPSSIYHVGMYIGGGKMVHAPTTGDVVRVATVRWSRFFAATRVFDAVPAPNSTPTTRPPTTPPPTTTPPTTTPPTTTPPTTPPPTTTPPTTPPTTTTPLPTLTPRPTGGDPTKEPTKEPTDGPTEEPTGQPTGTDDEPTGEPSATRSSPAAATTGASPTGS